MGDLERIGRFGTRCRSLAGVLLVAALGSCANDQVGGEDANLDLAAGQLAVGAEPSLTIGKEGDSRYEFTELVGAGRLSSGEWAVFDRGSKQLRVYSTAGEHVRSVGRAGEGPGEFRDVLHMSVGSDDRIRMYDQMLRRVTVVNGSGRIGGTYSLAAPGTGTVPSAVGFLGDGGIVVQTHVVSGCRPGIVSDDTTVFFAVPFESGRPAQAIAREHGMQRWGNVLNVLGTCMGQVVPFAPGPVAAVADGALYVAVRGEYSLKQYNVPSGEAHMINMRTARRGVSRETIEQHIAGQVASTPRDELGRELPRDQGMQLYERRLRELPYPDSLPIFDRIVVDALGLVWVRQYTLASDTLSTWIVVRRDGASVGRVQLPGQFTVLDIGRNYVAGHFRDDYDVQRFVVYPISRN